MRVAVYHNQPPGGARRALHGFARELAKSHRVDFFTLTSADQQMLDDQEVSSSMTRLAYAPRRQIRMGLYLNDFRRNQDHADLRRVNARSAALIDAGGYDVALVDACRFTYAPHVLAQLRTPSAYYCHHRPRLSHEAPARPPASVYARARRLWHLPFALRYERRLWRDDFEGVRAATRLLTNSANNARRLAEVYGAEAVVCPPGVDLPPPSAGFARKHLLAVGAVEAHKGFDFLIDAVALVPPGLRLPLHIAAYDGNPYLGSLLLRRAQERGVDLRLRWRQDQAELAREYGAAQVFLWGSRCEPLGLAPLEAMANAVPVVAVAEGGVTEVVGEGRTGYLLPRDPAAFAERLAELLASARLRRQMGEAARGEVEAHWTWPKRAAALERELVLATAARLGAAAKAGTAL